MAKLSEVSGIGSWGDERAGEQLLCQDEIVLVDNAGHVCSLAVIKLPPPPKCR